MKRYANIYIMNSFSWAKVITNPSSMKHTTSLYIDIPGHLKKCLANALSPWPKNL